MKSPLEVIEKMRPANDASATTINATFMAPPPPPPPPLSRRLPVP